MMVVAVLPKYNFVYDGAVLNVFHVNKGQGLPRHEHLYAHATFCCSGSCYVRKEGKEILITKESQPLNLLASEWHEIEAAEDGTVFINVFSEGKM